MSFAEADLRSGVDRLFEPVDSAASLAIGVELELIPLDASSKRRVLATPPQTSRSVAALRALQRERGWVETDYGTDPPSWALPDGSCISFEPGGQIEISSAPHASASSMIAAVTDLTKSLTNVMSAAGIALVTKGVDPYNSIEDVPLQLQRERYADMTRYFERLGPSGIQMMRQTAALQINVERGQDPVRRWRLLNALSPFVLALFANSAEYAGTETGWASYRSYFWRTLDPSRTGLVAPDGNPAEGYFEFAMEAFAMRSGTSDPAYRSFRDQMSHRPVDAADWQFHLSTLFPEVRAKEHFELRSADTIDVDELAAPVVFVSSLVYDDESADRAAALLPRPSLCLLERAGKSGINDREIHGIAAQLATLAIEGAERLGEDYLTHDHVRIARNYYERKLRLD